MSKADKCVIRIGDMADSTLISSKIAILTRVCAPARPVWKSGSSCSLDKIAYLV